MADLGKEYSLKGEYIGFYPKYNEELEQSFDVFKYALSGSPEAIAEFKKRTKEKGYNVNTTEDGRPIFFTLDFSGPRAEIKITTGGAIVINDEQIRQLQSLAKKTSGIIQEKIADQGVAMLLGNIFGKNAPVASTEGTEEPSEEEPAVEPSDADMGEGGEE